jgi:histone demethylase JARID1
MTGFCFKHEGKINCIGQNIFLQDFPLNTRGSKGTVRGCPNCSNYVKVNISFSFHIVADMTISIYLYLLTNVCYQVTAKWHPEDARREVIEEVPVFHPTEEVNTT